MNIPHTEEGRSHWLSPEFGVTNVLEEREFRGERAFQLVKGYRKFPLLPLRTFFISPKPILVRTLFRKASVQNSLANQGYDDNNDCENFRVPLPRLSMTWSEWNRGQVSPSEDLYVYPNDQTHRE